MRTAFFDTLTGLAAADRRIWLLTGDLGYSCIEPFAEHYPERFINAGIAEQNMMGVAAGLALSGKIVFVYSIANFPTMRCLEQIRNDVCYHNANVIIVAVGAGFTYGSQGYTHHGIEDIAVMSALPNMGVVAPGDPEEVRQLLPQMVSAGGPHYLRIGRAGEPAVHATPSSIRLGHAAKLRDGGDLTILACGGMLDPAMKAATVLAADGISAGVLSIHTVSPLDTGAVLRAAQQTRRILTVEEHSAKGGFGTMIAACLMEAGVSTRFAKVAADPAALSVVGSQTYLRARMGDIVGAARSLLGGGQRGGSGRGDE